MQGSGCRVQVLKFRVDRVDHRDCVEPGPCGVHLVKVWGVGVWGLGFRVQHLGFRVWGLDFRG